MIDNINCSRFSTCRVSTAAKYNKMQSLSLIWMYEKVWTVCEEQLMKFIYLFVCCMWLLGCIIFWGHSCAADTVPAVSSKLVLILPISKVWQSESTHLVLIQQHDRGTNSRPQYLQPANLPVKPTPGLFYEVVIILISLIMQSFTHLK